MMLRGRLVVVVAVMVVVVNDGDGEDAGDEGIDVDNEDVIVDEVGSSLQRNKS